MSGDVLEIGSVVGDRYRVESCLGRGPLGYSYLAHDLKEAGVAVVLKEVLVPGGEEHDSRVLLQRLARLSTLGHPGLARLRDFGAIENPRRLFLVRDHLQGEAISQVLASTDCEAIIEILIQLCRTLQFLHRHGMTHGNIKDTNVFLARRTGERIEAVLADCGLGSVAAMSAISSASIAWRAPEVLVGYAESPRSDLYSLGVLSYFLLARHLPFEDEDPGYLIQKSLQGSPDFRKLEGMESGPALVQVIRNLMDKNPEQRPTSAEEVIRLLSVARARDYTRVVPDLPRSHFGTSAFVDRKEEMALLAERAQRVRATGQGWTVFVTGESGSGKSRCMAEFRIAALLQGWRVFESDCLPSEDQAYGPFRRFLQWTDSVYPAETAEGREAHGVPGLADPPPVDHQAQGMVAETAVGRYRDLITRELVRRISGRPTIYMLHDCHWADEATAAVLAYLISDIRAHPVMILVSYRAGEARGTWFSKVVEQAKRQEQAEVLALSALDPDAVKAMVASMTGEAGLGDALGPWVHRSSGGNPLFVEEILKQLAEKGGIARESGRWVVREGRLEELEVPSGVAVVLRKRLEQLSQAERRIVEWLAVSGHAMPAPMLRDLCGMSREVFAAALRDLAVRQIVEPVGHLDTDHIAFRHAVIAEVIRGGVAASRRRRMHIRIGEALENSGAGERRVTELARHFTEGRAGDKAVRYALQAAQACRGEYSNEAALRFYEYVLAHGDSLPFEVRCEAALEASDACCLLGLPRRALRILRNYATKSFRGNRELRVKLCSHLAWVAQHCGDMRAIAYWSRKGLRILRQFDQPSIKHTSNLLKMLAYSDMSKSRTSRALSALNKALTHDLITSQPLLASQIYSTMCATYRVACQLRQALMAGRVAVKILEGHVAPEVYPSSQSHLGICYTALGRFRHALASLEKAATAASKARSTALITQSLGNLAECLCRMGDLDRAMIVCQKAADKCRQMQNPAIQHPCEAILAEILICRGDYHEAAAMLTKLRSVGRILPPIMSRAHVSYLSAWLEAELGNETAAHRHIKSLQNYQSSVAPIYEADLGLGIQAQLIFNRGAQRRALKILDVVRRRLRIKRWPYQLCQIELIRAELNIASDKLDIARQCCRIALRLSIAMGSRLLEAKARLLTAKLLMSQVSANLAGNTSLINRESEMAILEAARGELMRSAELAQESNAKELIWRINAERAKNEAMLCNRREAYHYANKAIQTFNAIIMSLPFDMRKRYVDVTYRKELIWQCNAIVGDNSQISPGRNDGAIGEAHLKSLLRLGQIFSTNTEICHMLGMALDISLSAINAEKAYILMGDERKMLTAKCVRERNGHKSADLLELCMPIIDNVYNTGCPFITSNIKTDSRCVAMCCKITEWQRSIICAPLKASNEVIGVLYVEGQTYEDNISESLISYVSAVATFIGMAIESALSRNEKKKEIAALESQIKLAREGYREIVGVSKAIREVRERMAAVSVAPTDVLICGETGTGKELVARGLHRTGRRAGGVFVAIDCGSLTDSLAESELFGYRKGAFTGATESRAGLFEAAQGGVVFLDEVSSLPMRLQSKLLRVLQEREVRRIGEVTPRKIDVQIIAATNKDLLAEIEKGKFRRDLYHRLNVMQIRVPPLRDRAEDIPILIDWFLGNLAQGRGGEVKTFSNEAKQLLMEYPYPGNVRELAHIVESSYYLARGRVIQLADLPAEVRGMEIIENATWNSESHALMILRRIDKGEGNFYDLVKVPFMRHRIGVDVVRRLLHKALSDAGGLYKSAFQRLGIPDREYATVKQFLKRNGCYLDFRPYRKGGGR